METMPKIDMLKLPNRSSFSLAEGDEKGGMTDFSRSGGGGKSCGGGALGGGVEVEEQTEASEEIR